MILDVVSDTRTQSGIIENFLLPILVPLSNGTVAHRAVRVRDADLFLGTTIVPARLYQYSHERTPILTIRRPVLLYDHPVFSSAPSRYKSPIFSAFLQSSSFSHLNSSFSSCRAPSFLRATLPSLPPSHALPPPAPPAPPPLFFLCLSSRRARGLVRQALVFFCARMPRVCVHRS